MTFTHNTSGLYKKIFALMAAASVFLFGSAAYAATGIDLIASSVIDSSIFLPGLVSAASYLTGLALGVMSVLNFKKHVEMGPREVPLRTPIVQFVASGLLLALPFTYEVLISSIYDGPGFALAGANFYGTGGGEVNMLIGGTVTTWGSPAAACASASFPTMLGGIMCSVWDSISTLPGLLAGFSYIAGLTFIYLATLSLKESVENPGQTSLWVPLQRYLVAALLLALPWVLEVLTLTMFRGTFAGAEDTGYTLWTAPSGDQTLDLVVANFVFNIQGVMRFVFSGFGYIAGATLIIIGIFRLMKTMQDGPRGPGGIGTIMTFVTGAALLSLSPSMAALSVTLFGDNIAETNVDLTIPGGGLVDYEQRMENFISSVVAYMWILGFVSVIRGLFLFRGVAEGDQQSSMMAAVTHLIAGALLANLGPFLLTVQNTLGPIAGLPGLTFS